MKATKLTTAILETLGCTIEKDYSVKLGRVKQTIGAKRVTLVIPNDETLDMDDETSVVYLPFSESLLHRMSPTMDRTIMLMNRRLNGLLTTIMETVIDHALTGETPTAAMRKYQAGLENCRPKTKALLAKYIASTEVTCVTKRFVNLAVTTHKPGEDADGGDVRYGMITYPFLGHVEAEKDFCGVKGAAKCDLLVLTSLMNTIVGATDDGKMPVITLVSKSSLCPTFISTSKAFHHLLAQLTLVAKAFGVDEELYYVDAHWEKMLSSMPAVVAGLPHDLGGNVGTLNADPKDTKRAPWVDSATDKPAPVDKPTRKAKSTVSSAPTAVNPFGTRATVSKVECVFDEATGTYLPLVGEVESNVWGPKPQVMPQATSEWGAAVPQQAGGVNGTQPISSNVW